MMVLSKSSTHLRIAAATVLLVAILVSCHGLAQDAPPDPRKASPIPAAATQSGQPAGNAANGGANLAGGQTSPASASPVPSGIPTDPLGIADAMGRPFTAAFIAASIIGVWSVIERLVILRRRRVIPKAFVERFLMHLRGADGQDGSDFCLPAE